MDLKTALSMGRKIRRTSWPGSEYLPQDTLKISPADATATDWEPEPMDIRLPLEDIKAAYLRAFGDNTGAEYLKFEYELLLGFPEREKVREMNNKLPRTQLIAAHNAAAKNRSSGD